MKEAEMTFENVKLMLHGVLDLESLRFITNKLDASSSWLEAAIS